jgi:hypothetical protein
MLISTYLSWARQVCSAWLIFVDSISNFVSTLLWCLRSSVFRISKISWTRMRIFVSKDVLISLELRYLYTTVFSHCSFIAFVLRRASVSWGYPCTPCVAESSAKCTISGRSTIDVVGPIDPAEPTVIEPDELHVITLKVKALARIKLDAREGLLTPCSSSLSGP